VLTARASGDEALVGPFSFIVDQKNHRLMGLVNGRTGELEAALTDIP
jgi:hypothetical protein